MALLRRRAPKSEGPQTESSQLELDVQPESYESVPSQENEGAEPAAAESETPAEEPKTVIRRKRIVVTKAEPSAEPAAETSSEETQGENKTAPDSQQSENNDAQFHQGGMRQQRWNNNRGNRNDRRQSYRERIAARNAARDEATAAAQIIENPEEYVGQSLEFRITQFSEKALPYQVQ